MTQMAMSSKLSWTAVLVPLAMLLISNAWVFYTGMELTETQTGVLQNMLYTLVTTAGAGASVGIAKTLKKPSG
jgi:hypothetical protein